MKIEINISKRGLFIVLGLVLILSFFYLAYAYRGNMNHGNPEIMGHSAGEIMVRDKAGRVVSLQQFIDEINFGGSRGNNPSLPENIGGYNCTWRWRESSPNPDDPLWYPTDFRWAGCGRSGTNGACIYQVRWCRLLPLN